MRKLVALCLAAFTMASTLMVLAAPTPASAAPADYQMPFPCGETWQATTYAGHTSNAVDFNYPGGDYGRSVVASAAGTAYNKSDPGGYGNYVDVVHSGGWVTRYAHLSSYVVGNGTVVARGTVIGKVGSTGNSTGDHLHYEQRLNNVAQAITFNGSAISYTYGGVSYTSKNCNTPPPAAHMRSDFNGDGKDDLAWYNAGQIASLMGNGTKFNYGAATTGIGKPGWAGVGDYNGDGKSDLAWWENGHISTLMGNGTKFNYGAQTTGIGKPEWAGSGSFSGTNGDGNALNPPGAPSIGTAIAGNASVTLSWATPVSNGSSAITGYVVTPYVGATAQTARTFNSTTTTQTITGLTNGVSYTFKVAAKNAIGTGPHSAASNAVKPSGSWYLRNANSAGSSTGGFNYGGPGLIPITGDWDGNGTTTIGSYNPSTSQWFLRNSNSAGSSIGGFTFGSPGDIPVVGDWDGNGTTTIGVYRPSTGYWYLRNTNSAGSSIGGFKYTVTGASPVTGDWDGNKTTTIGLFNPSTATWYLRNTNTSATPAGGFVFGSAGDKPVTGNWDGSGGDTIGVYRPSTSSWYLRNANSAGSSIGGFQYGNPGDKPVTGNWDASGGDTIGVYR